MGRVPPSMLVRAELERLVAGGVERDANIVSALVEEPLLALTMPSWGCGSLGPSAPSGKSVQVGRVNSWRRLDLMASWNVDSVDGT